MESDGEKVTPVTIVTGFLGSGKTTLLKHILSGDHGLKIAVIQNELAGERGIEAPAANGVVGPNGEVFADWVELANGCVCCSVRDDLVSALEVLVKREGFDNILIETTGLADPGPLASIFWVDEALNSAVQLDAIVTVVDLKYCARQLDEERPQGEVNECARQLAFADRLILNKRDMVSDEEAAELTRRIRGINPEAPIYESVYSRVPLEAILGVSAFKLERAAELLACQPCDEPEASAHNHAPGEACQACEGLGPGPQGPRPLGARHGDQVGAVTLRVAGELELQSFRSWLGLFLWEHQAKLGMDVYRYKGLLSLVGEEQQFILQGVRDTFEIEPGPTTKPGCNPVNKFVFIGKGLDVGYLQAQLQGLVAGRAAAS